MEPNSIEKLIKTAINERRIEPSAAARMLLIEALNAKLKRKNRIWLRYGVAASIVFLLCFTGGRLLMKNVDVEDPIEVTFQKDMPESKKEDKLDNTIIRKQIIEEPSISIHDINSKSNRTTKKAIVTATHTEKKHLNTEIKKNQSNALKEKPELEFVSSPILSKDVIKVSEVVIRKDTIAKKTEQLFPYVTPEALLAAVEGNSSQLLKVKVTAPTNYVNSDRLLLEMERQLFDEENKSIFKKATKQLKKIKTAVANRNFKD
jgi:hypothetical protein